MSLLFSVRMINSLTSCPELVCLLEEGEELDGLLALQPEAILLRWFNYHLERVSDVVAFVDAAAAVRSYRFSKLPGGVCCMFCVL